MGRSSDTRETLDSEDEGSVARLVVELEKLGIDEALREAGAKPGTTF